MGCDIHFYVEKKNAKGEWLSADTFNKETDCGEVWYHQVKEFYEGRNYNLFAILADVRNGYGFAGCKTGDGFNPISQPRGVPHDMSVETKRAVDSLRGDGHSHSWFTLRELLDYDWTQTTKLQGWVDFATWEDWSRWDRSHGEGPSSTCGSVDGGSVKHISAEQMDQLVADFRKLGGLVDREERETFLKKHQSTYALAQWETPYYRAAGSFLDETIPRLLKLAGGVKGVDDVRIVFFFDN